MKETINFYYKVYPDKIYEINNGCYFIFNTYKYYFVEYTGPVQNIDFLVKITNDLYNRNILVDTFIKNKDGNYFVILNKTTYVLLRVNSVENDIYNLNDIVYFNNLLISNSNISINGDWATLWKNKVDIFEEEVSELNNDYPLVLESFDYYVGLAENAISYFIDALELNEKPKITLCHKRLLKIVYSGFINNPLTFAFDYEVRDVAEYIKVKFFEDSLNFDEISNVINQYNKVSLMMLFSRLLYPSYYFDTVKQIFINEIEEKELLKYINRLNEYQDLLIDIYNLINKKVNIPVIEWLKNN